ncbi:PH domain-containing protein [Pararobbsia alpina]|uniref:YdbS-like PH domain-containing protein n=1 Tax=Pararobbsia alpina TaxID=621374 RepID=A0A6S7CMI6_9BURK|nr:PH domain-containing protein [Pararobbsia alpina]CAB3783594.1 hypothetical protein LMG28138_01672 [Pararobbsia alpina]
MANQVIFKGAPSQVINIPALFKGSAVVALIFGIHLCTAGYFPFHWQLLFAQIVAVMVGVGLPILKTAFTEIVVDTERITWTQGILRRRVYSLELARIRRVSSVHPWWQGMLGTGSVILMTDDPAHPVRRLPGIRHADQLRTRLEEAVAIRQER